jgi:DNA-binding HxlR family transcriptional regulator
MTEASYKSFCPLAMASEVLCTRWTMMLVRELLLGTSRFNDLRRGVPRMSPALLSKRLRDLEVAGILERVADPKGLDLHQYGLTEAGRALKPVVDALGDWGHQWVTTASTIANLDVNLLMWNMRRNINTEPFPHRRSLVQIIYNDLKPSQRNWWLIVEPGKEVDLCSVDPGFDVDLYVTTDLRTMTEVWMGYTTITRAQHNDQLIVTGDPKLSRSLQLWLGSSRFARMDKRVA